MAVRRPTSSAFISSLPKLTVTEANNPHRPSCAICKDDLCLGESVTHLPCDHYFHQYCIVTWLQQKNTCPLCRREFPAQEQQRQQRRQVMAVWRQERMAVILRQQQERQGPTSPAFISSLPKLTVTEANNPYRPPCAICTDNLCFGESVTHLPCDHYFHQYCIVTWLQQKNTCPLCRRKFPVQEQQRQPRRLVVTLVPERAAVLEEQMAVWRQERMAILGQQRERQAWNWSHWTHWWANMRIPRGQVLDGSLSA